MSASGGRAAARGRRRRRRGGEIEHNPDRWMASYMDVVTVLMCMFIVLYAMSTVDDEKYAALRQSLAEGFGSSPEVMEASGLLETELDENRDLEEAEEGEDLPHPDDLLAQQELDDLRELKRQLRQALSAAGHDDAAEFVIDDRGLTVRLVGAETFFGSNRSDLVAEGRDVLGAISPVLAAADRDYEIGGHADRRDPGYPYPTNWELSSNRATTVLRELVENGGVQPTRIISVGYGHNHPISEDNLRQNRRVDITVLSDQPEHIRDIIYEYSVESGSAGSQAAPRTETFRR